MHPAYIANGLSVPSSTGKGFAPAMDYTQYGATGTGFLPYSVTGRDDQRQAGLRGRPRPPSCPGPLPASVAPAALNATQTNPALQKVGIDQVGCIVCHNGGRLALNQTDAHQNLIVNPEYDFTAGAQLYYKYCVTCHGVQGEGGKGPPLNNQDRLGYFNEDYYYRCIEYGFTDFEHIGSIMPNWGSDRLRLHVRPHPRQAEARQPDPQRGPDPHPDPVHPPLGELHHPAVGWRDAR